ncbi:MAG: precorrin-3B C(17)-methyltransferase [Chloroflexi bacterium RBG_16_50_9]|nr:MAG: precorrin-3B C(17)-methyltransferase [Chloroflexi bacterium RBG_16_50_9]
MNNDNLNNKEDTAIVAITRRGVALGRRLQRTLPGSRLYLPDKFAGETAADEVYFTSAKDLMADIFRRYRYLVLIMAAGIAVRLAANELRDKHHDPGVVVVDDAGSFCISLLSGHIGGANELARRIASQLGAQPVITTASDVNGTLSLDLLGREFGWEIEDDTYLKDTSAALVNGEPVGVYQDAGEPDWWPAASLLPDSITVYPSLEALQQSGASAALIITDRILGEESYRSLPKHIIIYRPKSLVLGIGCNRGTGSTAIETAVSQALSSQRLSAKCVRKIATIDLKRDEAGLFKFARDHALPVEYHDRETLRQASFPSGPSAAAVKYVGTPSVCEAAALLSSHTSHLLVPKVRSGRSVTVAVARFSFDSRPPSEKGRLFLVGIGPGDLKYLTFAARDALDRSEVVIGYETYIDLIKPLLGRKRIIATGMGAEMARVKTAIDLVKQGKTVSLISSGDCGIYGMAGPVGEFLREQPEPDVEVRVIPGVPALAACAALLRSPISGDFVSISLSDYLVPWEEICRRLEMAAQGDFVIVLYNPQSKHRRRQLARAREIIMRHRLPVTPVGIVTNAYRPGQAVTITDLEHLLDYDIGMSTTVIIGNSVTFAGDGWMGTPRGYYTKNNFGEVQGNIKARSVKP